MVLGWVEYNNKINCQSQQHLEGMLRIYIYGNVVFILNDGDEKYINDFTYSTHRLHSGKRPIGVHTYRHIHTSILMSVCDIFMIKNLC